MSSKATRYAISFKKEAVLNYLQFKISSPDANMNDFLTKFNYHFAVSCFYKWLRIFKDELMTKYQLPINAVENKYGSTANDLTLSQKMKIILEVANLNSNKVISEKELKKNNLLLLRKNHELEEKLRHKDKIIDRKNASLAEYAAKVVTLTNFNQLFKDNKED